MSYQYSLIDRGKIYNLNGHFLDTKSLAAITIILIYYFVLFFIVYFFLLFPLNVENKIFKPILKGSRCHLFLFSLFPGFLCQGNTTFQISSEGSFNKNLCWNDLVNIRGESFDAH